MTLYKKMTGSKQTHQKAHINTERVQEPLDCECWQSWWDFYYENLTLWYDGLMEHDILMTAVTLMLLLLMRKPVQFFQVRMRFCKSTTKMCGSLVHSKWAPNKPCGLSPTPHCSSTNHCLTVMVVFLVALCSCLVRGQVGLESTLCDIGYCTVLLAGCMDVGVEHAHAHKHTHTGGAHTQTQTRIAPLARSVFDMSSLSVVHKFNHHLPASSAEVACITSDLLKDFHINN